MDKQFLDLILLITTVISGAILAFSTQISEKYPKLKWIEKLGFKIPIALLLILITNFCSAKKERLSAEENQIQQNKKDSIHQRREDSLAYDFKKQIDSSYNKSIKSSNEALAKYNLTIIDSLHTVTSSINSKAIPTPQLSVAPVEQGRPPLYINSEADSTILSIRFISTAATSNRIEVTCYIAKRINDDLYVLQSEIIMTDLFLLPGVERTCRVPLTERITKEGVLYVLLAGKFSKDQKSKNFIPYRQVFRFNFKENKFIDQTTGIDQKSFKEYLKKHKL